VAGFRIKNLGRDHLLPGIFLVGRTVVGRTVVGRTVVGRTVVGRTVVGRTELEPVTPCMPSIISTFPDVRSCPNLLAITAISSTDVS
jgi:hypothetical protein